MSRQLQQRMSRARNVALAIGLLGLVACGVGAFTDTRQFFASYLFALLYWLGLALGSFTVAMIHHLTGGRWGFVIRRFLEAGFSTLPLLLLLFVPIFFGLRELYPWAQPDAAFSRVLQKRAGYMNSGGFITRAVCCLVLWCVMAWLLRRWSLLQDSGDHPRASRRLRMLSGPGVLLYPLTATFVYIDWIMSLEPKWYSTIFAVIIVAGQVLSAFAFSTVLLKLFHDEEPIAEHVTNRVFHQLGNLLLTFLLFWTYVSFSQLLIIYSANLPQEISWYLHRIAGGWNFVIATIAALHFLLPFVLLLFRVTKKSPVVLARLAAMLLLIHLVEMYWVVAPSLHPAGVVVSWLDFAAPVGIGGVWVAAFLWLLARAPLLPLNDPRMKEEFAHAA